MTGIAHLSAPLALLIVLRATKVATEGLIKAVEPFDPDVRYMRLGVALFTAPLCFLAICAGAALRFYAAPT